MNESISALLLLFVFIGLSFLRTAVENRASHEDDFNAMNKILALFSLITLVVLVCAIFCIIIGFTFATTGYLCLHGAALSCAVFLSLVFGGAPEACGPTVARYYGPRN